MRLIVELGEHTRCLAGLGVLEPGLLHLLADDLLQPAVARQAEQEVHPVLVGLAPGHQFLVAEARVAAQHDLHFRPLGAQLRHDALDFIQRTGGPIHVGRPEPRAQQLIAGEDIERQVTGAVVVTMPPRWKNRSG